MNLSKLRFRFSIDNNDNKLVIVYIGKYKYTTRIFNQVKPEEVIKYSYLNIRGVALYILKNDSGKYTKIEQGNFDHEITPDTYYFECDRYFDFISREGLRIT